MAKKIKVYSMQNCPYCDRAVNLLEQRGFDYEMIMVDDWSDEKWNELCKKTKMKTLPQIFADDQLIGGYSQLAEQDAKDRLASFK